MGNIDSRNERFYNLCGLGKAHLIEKMLENDRTLNTINVNWVAFETQSTPLLIVNKNVFNTCCFQRISIHFLTI